MESLNGLVSNEELVPFEQKQLFILTEILLTTNLPFAVPDNITMSEIVTVGCILRTNTLSFGADLSASKGLMFCPTAASFNHSCDPNAEYSFDGRVLRVASIKTIMEGEEVTISYVNRLTPKNDRQELLRGRYDFTCRCSACAREPEGRTD
jgi:SET and MYND domain-containing protein